jgi:hypothetical protein
MTEAARRHGTGDANGAVLALYRALVARRGDLRSQSLLLRLLFENPSLFSPPPPLPDPEPILVSVVACSIEERKLAGLRASCERSFGAWPWELVAIRDARSLCEGMRRGFGAAKGGLVVFCHDDIEILTPSLGPALARALSGADIVGVVGSTRLKGPAFAWGGKAFTRGMVAEPSKSGRGIDLVVYNPVPGIAGGMVALDGLFIAARREAVTAVGFDERTFDGFHLYDMDFCWRAHRAGLRLAVTSGIVVRHDSTGGFDARWEEYARRFLEKHPDVRGERVENVMSRLALPDAQALVHFCARLDEAGRQATLS